MMMMMRMAMRMTTRTRRRKGDDDDDNADHDDGAIRGPSSLESMNRTRIDGSQDESEDHEL
jgi:hypothetical protein